MADRQVNPCLKCEGDGLLDGEFCLRCLGTGFRGGKELHLYLKAMADRINDVMDKLDDVMDKIDDI